MELPKILSSKYVNWVLIGLGALIVLLVVFQLGVYVGFRKANFSFRWGENYHRAFGGPRGGFLREFEGRDYMNGYGTAGVVVKLDQSGLIVKGRDGVERLIRVSAGTSLVQGRERVALASLKLDDQVVIIGEPKNDGTIEAKIIRVFPAGQPVMPVPPMMGTQ